jgi:hypothetical protein
MRWEQHVSYTDVAIVECSSVLMGIFVMERTGTPFQKLFLKRTQAGMAFQNLFF